jgi:phage anti-repressor protein
MKTTVTLKGLLNIQQTTIDKNKNIETVSARELWVYLESKQDFSTWIKNRIADYDFKENLDYVLLHKKMEQVSGAKHTIEYYISISMAKELGMVERNEKGKEIRKYFIDCESKLIELKKELALKAKARDDARLEYKPMSTALKETRKALGKSTEHFHYSNEANLINVIVMGSTAKKLKEDWGLDNLDNLRDELTPQQIAAVQDLQKVNTSLIDVGLDYELRKEKLKALFSRKWSNLLIEEHIRLEA